MTLNKFLLNGFEALQFKLELTIMMPTYESGIIWHTRRNLPLSEFIYCVPIEKTVTRSEVTYDIPISGINMEGWMTLNPEFLTLNYNFEDDRNAFIWCWLSKTMEVGYDNRKWKPVYNSGGAQTP
jgi:hypothetical protein